MGISGGTDTSGSGVTGTQTCMVVFSWETDGKGCWGLVIKRQKYAKEFAIYLTSRIEIYEQESDMVRKRGKTNSGGTVQDH